VVLLLLAISSDKAIWFRALSVLPGDGGGPFCYASRARVICSVRGSATWVSVVDLLFFALRMLSLGARHGFASPIPRQTYP
jgi:hypothetical protein